MELEGGGGGGGVEKGGGGGHFLFFLSFFSFRQEEEGYGMEGGYSGWLRGVYILVSSGSRENECQTAKSRKERKVQFGQRFCPLAGSSSNTTTTTTKTTTIMADSSSIKRKAEAPTGGEEESSNNKRAKKVRLDNTKSALQFPSALHNNSLPVYPDEKTMANTQNRTQWRKKIPSARFSHEYEYEFEFEFYSASG